MNWPLLGLVVYLAIFVWNLSSGSSCASSSSERPFFKRRQETDVDTNRDLLDQPLSRNED